MTVGITCTECGEDVIFHIDGPEKRPVSNCGCGAVYELTVNKLRFEGDADA